MRTLVLALFLLAGVHAEFKLIAEHHHEDSDHGDRGALYRFGVDNIDQRTSKNLGRKHDVTVDIRLPIHSVVDEKYFYLEGKSDVDDAFKECDQQTDGADEILIRCRISTVITHTTLYVHAHFPKAKFSAAQLAHLERTQTKVRASLSHEDIHINDATLPLLSHWRNKEEL